MIWHWKSSTSKFYGIQILVSDKECCEGKATNTTKYAQLSKFAINSVKMRGVYSGDMMSPNAFFIMDRLNGTLEAHIKHWAELKKGTSSMLGLKKDKMARQQLLLERLVCAYDIAVAFAYIHENK